jgi:hypothetical protein
VPSATNRKPAVARPRPVRDANTPAAVGTGARVARSAEERAFLALGPGAERWLIQAAAADAQRVRRKMAEAVDLAMLHGAAEVDDALTRCADAGRFGDGDLATILAHRRQQAGGELIPFPARSEEHSLQPSTRSWEGLGR